MTGQLSDRARWSLMSLPHQIDAKVRALLDEFYGRLSEDDQDLLRLPLEGIADAIYQSARLSLPRDEVAAVVDGLRDLVDEPEDSELTFDGTSDELDIPQMTSGGVAFRERSDVMHELNLVGGRQSHPPIDAPNRPPSILEDRDVQVIPAPVDPHPPVDPRVVPFDQDPPPPTVATVLWSPDQDADPAVTGEHSALDSEVDADEHGLKWLIVKNERKKRKQRQVDGQ